MTDAPDRPPVSRGRTALSVLLVAVLYLWVFPYHAVVNNPNENVRLYMTVAVVDDHTFAINRVESLWGYVNDKSVREGRLYSSKAPGTSYVGVPFYWLLTKVTGRHALPPAHPPTLRPGVAPPRPLDRAALLYFLRLTGNALPALLFAWYWHRFLDRRTRSPALRDAVFFSTMAGSSIYAYSVVFASHAQNALCLGAALMALVTVRERDAEDRSSGRARVNPGLLFLAGLFGAGCTMFEYPAGIATLAVALWIASMGAERRRGLLALAAVALGVAGALAAKHQKGAAVAVGAVAALAYGATLSWRGVKRLAAAGLGGAIPTGLTLLYHKRCFGSPFKPGYSYLENPTFREETNQGFFGATAFSWEAGLRLWLDPAFGLIPSTPVFLLSLAGLATYFSWAPAEGEPETRGRFVGRQAASLLFAAASVFALLKGARATHGVELAHAHDAAGPWVAALAFSLFAMLSAQLPRPRRPSAALGAAMAFACLGLTRLIGAMNNWRGGWQVGPRYLVTLIPVLGLTALAALDAMYGEGRGARARAATLFAGGATVCAMLVTGVPSAWFPHIPTEFGAPFFELFTVLLHGGFVPHNAGHLAHLSGMASMAVFLVAAAAIAWRVARGDERRPLAVLAHAAGVAAVALVLLVPQAAAFRPESAGPTRYVMGAFEPRPVGDAAATAAVAPRETAAQSAARARRLAERGEQAAALEAWLRVIRSTP